MDDLSDDDGGFDYAECPGCGRNGTLDEECEECGEIFEYPAQGVCGSCGATGSAGLSCSNCPEDSGTIYNYSVEEYVDGGVKEKSSDKKRIRDFEKDEDDGPNSGGEDVQEKADEKKESNKIVTKKKKTNSSNDKNS
jgi:hypothetical protein